MAIVNVHFNDIKNQILTVLNSAKSSIQVCMAWLTDKQLMDKLIEKLDQGIDVQICLLDHRFNQIKLPKDYGSKLENLQNYYVDFNTFQNKGGMLDIIPTNLGFIHHKFAVIDRRISITGSYNWSPKASRNKENIVIIEDAIIAEKFINHLDEIIDSFIKYAISLNFDQCTINGCEGKVVKIKVIDKRSVTSYYQHDNYYLTVCTGDEQHISIIDDDTETDSISEYIDHESDRIEDEFAEKNIKYRSVLVNRKIDSEIALSLGSRLDSLVEKNSHSLLGFYEITKDMDNFDELRTIWEHKFMKLIDIQENEIINSIDYCNI